MVPTAALITTPHRFPVLSDPVLIHLGFTRQTMVSLFTVDDILSHASKFLLHHPSRRPVS